MAGWRVALGGVRMRSLWPVAFGPPRFNLRRTKSAVSSRPSCHSCRQGVEPQCNTELTPRRGGGLERAVRPRCVNMSGRSARRACMILLQLRHSNTALGALKRTRRGSGKTRQRGAPKHRQRFLSVRPGGWCRTPVNSSGTRAVTRSRRRPKGPLRPATALRPLLHPPLQSR
jgi:hypothetical protein